MLTFREFIHICEGKKTPPGAVKGTYQEKDGVKTYTLAPYEGPSGPLKSEKKVMKVLDNQGGIGGGAIKKAKKKVEKAKRIKEDVAAQYRAGQLAYQSSAPARLATRKSQAKERQSHQMAAHKEKVAAYQETQKRNRQKEIERKDRQEELQIEQHPLMKPTLFNMMKAKEQAKGGPKHRTHVHGELAALARSQEAAHQARLKKLTGTP